MSGDFAKARELLDQAERTAVAGMQYGALLYLLRIVIEDLETASRAGVEMGTLKPYQGEAA